MRFSESSEPNPNPDPNPNPNPDPNPNPNPNPNPKPDLVGAVLRVLRARRAAEGVLHRDRVVLGPDHGVVYPHVPAAREVEAVRVEGAQVDLGSGLG